MRLGHFLRMARWARHPPSPARVLTVVIVVAVCIGLFGLEWFGLLPEGFGLLPDRPSHRLKFRPLEDGAP